MELNPGDILKLEGQDWIAVSHTKTDFTKNPPQSEVVLTLLNPSFCVYETPKGMFLNSDPEAGNLWEYQPQK